MTLWIDLVKGTYDIGKEFGLWQALRRKLRRTRKILVLGASGAGKTQFVISLSIPVPERLTVRHRTVSVQPRQTTIGEYPFLLVYTPGQRMDEPKRKDALYD